MKKKSTYLILILIAYLFINSKEAIYSITTGLDLFIKNVLPSLFPFFVLSNMLFALGFANDIAPLFKKPMKLFSLSKNAAFPILLSFISGYPIGSKTVCEMYENNYFSKNEAQRLLTICSNPSPIFIIATVGITFLNNKITGMILLFSIYITAILLCFLTSVFSKSKNTYSYKQKEEKQSFYKIFSNAISGSMINLLNILGYILFFSLVINIFDNTIFPLLKNISPKWLIAIFKGMMEMTIGCKEISTLKSIDVSLMLTILSFILGFGGLCANFQCLSFINKTDLSEQVYLFSKLIYGLINAFITFIFTKIISKEAISCFYVGYMPGMNLEKILIFQGIIIFVFLIIYVLIKLFWDE